LPRDGSCDLDGVRSFLENSTACRKSVPFFGLAWVVGWPVRVAWCLCWIFFGEQTVLLVMSVAEVMSCPSQGGSGSLLRPVPLRAGVAEDP
jgi:hypothetical protein